MSGVPLDTAVTMTRPGRSLTFLDRLGAIEQRVRNNLSVIPFSMFIKSVDIRRHFAFRLRLHLWRQNPASCTIRRAVSTGTRAELLPRTCGEVQHNALKKYCWSHGLVDPHRPVTEFQVVNKYAFKAPPERPKSVITEMASDATAPGPRTAVAADYAISRTQEAGILKYHIRIMLPKLVRRRTTTDRGDVADRHTQDTAAGSSLALTRHAVCYSAPGKYHANVRCTLLW